MIQPTYAKYDQRKVFEVLEALQRLKKSIEGQKGTGTVSVQALHVCTLLARLCKLNSQIERKRQVVRAAC